MWTAGRFWQVLMVIAVLGAMAMLFGPASRWLGVDLGATGASLFFLSLAGLITFVAMKPREIFPDEWSLAERRGWVSVVMTTLILVTLVKYVSVLAGMDPVPTWIGELPRRPLSNVVVLAIAWGVCEGLLAKGAGPVTEDERDLRLRLAADGVGDLALSLAIVTCVVLLASLQAAYLEWWLKPLVLANVLVALLIARSLIENLALITLYARARR